MANYKQLKSINYSCQNVVSISYVVGAFGNVKVGWLKDKPEKKYAIKTMKKLEIITSKHVDHIENEKKILEMLTHPFVVRLLYLKLHSSHTTVSFKIIDTFISQQNF